MKKIICALLCLIMTFVATVGLAAVTYTLPEKMSKQLEIGSGLKGSFTIHGEGNAPWILSISPLQDVEFQFRAIRNGDEFHAYLYQAGEDEVQHGLTEYYEKGDTAYFRSDLLPGQVLLLPGVAGLIDHYSASKGGNPSILSALWRYFQMDPEERSAIMEPVVQMLTADLEIWISAYAEASPVRIQSNGTSVVDLSYTIPMREARNEILHLITVLTGSESGRRFLDALLTDEQKGVYAREDLIWYYGEALQALNNDYDIVYTNTISTMGQTVSSTLELPLDGRTMRYDALTIENNGGLTSYTLRSEDEILTIRCASDLSLDRFDSLSFWVIRRPADGAAEEETPRQAVRVDLSRERVTSTDEESRDHLTEHWNMTAERDVSRLPEGEKEEDYPEFPPVQMALSLHYYSRYSQSSPTTLEVDGKLTGPDYSLSLAGTVKTASPWVFSPFSTEGAKDIRSMTPMETGIMLAEWLAAAGEQMVPGAPQETGGVESTEMKEKNGSPEAATDGSEEEPVTPDGDNVKEDMSTESENGAAAGVSDSSLPEKKTDENMDGGNAENPAREMPGTTIKNDELEAPETTDVSAVGEKTDSITMPDTKDDLPETETATRPVTTDTDDLDSAAASAPESLDASGETVPGDMGGEHE